MHRTTVYLDAQTYAELKRLARAHDATYAAIVREAVRCYAGRARARGLRCLGAGAGDGTPVGRSAEDLLRRAVERRGAWRSS